DLIMRLERARTLEKHSRSVSTLSFNADGDILVSGSDDRDVILWDWETGCVKLSFNSRHRRKVMEAKIMPETGDRSIVTCGADGQFDLRTRKPTKLFTCQPACALSTRLVINLNAIAIDPRNPNLFVVVGISTNNLDARMRITRYE
ncbi:DDB1- and CUL4-associated factor 8-like protein, partial [Tanacetum coccineum]